MRCCDQCFLDVELKGDVIGLGAPETGTCDFCHRAGVSLIDATELEEKIMSLAGLFEPTGEQGALLLHAELQQRWNLFSSAAPEDWKNLLVAILFGIYPADHPLLTHPVSLLPLPGQDDGVAQERLWHQFAVEIKYHNRFFLHQPVELGLLINLFSKMANIYPPGTVFYRGRVGKREPYSLAEMGKPPVAQATAGRANPVGIPYLYVAKHLPTTVYESRCTYLDFLSVAEYTVREPLRVLSLQGISKISPFRWQDSLAGFLVYEQYLAKLESELSRPLRRFDNSLDYLPTEYLCEYIKSLGYDGIEYGSALHRGGVNLAIFNDHKLEGGAVAVYEVISIELEVRQVSEE